MSVTYTTDPTNPYVDPVPAARADLAHDEPFVPVYARRGKARGGQGKIKTWMILTPVAAIVLGGIGAMLVMGGPEESAAPLVEPARTGPVLSATRTAPAAAPLTSASTPEPVVAPAPTVREAAPLRRPAPAPVRREAVRAPAPVAETPRVQTPTAPTGPQPYTAAPATTPPTTTLNTTPTVPTSPPPIVIDPAG